MNMREESKKEQTKNLWPMCVPCITTSLRLSGDVIFTRTFFLCAIVGNVCSIMTFVRFIMDFLRSFIKFLKFSDKSPSHDPHIFSIDSAQ